MPSRRPATECRRASPRRTACSAIPFASAHVSPSWRATAVGVALDGRARSRSARRVRRRLRADARDILTHLGIPLKTATEAVITQRRVDCTKGANIHCDVRSFRVSPGFIRLVQRYALLPNPRFAA